MDDLRDIQVEFEAVCRSDGNRRQVGIELMRFSLAGCPVQDHIGGGNVGHLVSVGIDRVLARVERVDPNAFVAAVHEIPVPKGLA